MSAPVARNVVRRTRLLDRLDVAMSSPVVLVCAPAGYGKSMLVSSWLVDRAVENAVWVSLSSTPQGSAGVWATVVAGLNTVLPDPA
ncbi:MAG TPA: hypothetical protein VFU98_03955, partial [Microlunatus sp.]|nr:hypothetical protein [Microlunatus sp.]